MVRRHRNGSAPANALSSGPGGSYPTIKRRLDKVVAAVALVVLAPLFLLVAAAIRLASSGPILYLAKRSGLHGDTFTMYKFRTMRQAGEASPASLITAKGDTRVFAVGTWLRRLKIDELPQLINVVRGEMSLVGPRPEDPQIVEEWYQPEQYEVFSALPGLASPGSIYNYTHGEQILGDSNPEKAYVERLLPIKLACDIVYVREASLIYDLKIILRTIWTILAVVAGKKHFSDPPEMKKAREIVSQFTGEQAAQSAPNLR